MAEITMTDINLLPWRELKREREKKQFITYLLVGLFSSIIIVFLINYYATSLVDMQTDRNQRLKNEIAQLDSQIKEISDNINNIINVVNDTNIVSIQNINNENNI